MKNNKYISFLVSNAVDELVKITGLKYSYSYDNKEGFLRQNDKLIVRGEPLVLREQVRAILADSNLAQRVKL